MVECRRCGADISCLIQTEELTYTSEIILGGLECDVDSGDLSDYKCPECEQHLFDIEDDVEAKAFLKGEEEEPE